MEIVINLEDSVPMFTQLMEQIKEAVVNNKLKPGDAIPSIRQLANDLDINSKTVAKAYRLLERDSIIEAKGYRGSYIHKNAKENCSVDLTDWVNTTLANNIKVFREKGVTDSEIRIAFAQVMKQ